MRQVKSAPPSIAAPESPPPARRTAWFWLATLLVPIVLFLAVLGAMSVSHRSWYVPWTTPLENPQAEERGLAPWLPKDRRAALQHRIEVIDSAIPAIEGETRFLDQALQKEQTRVATSAEAKEFAAFIRREQQFLAIRIDELRADRAYFSRELNEK